MGKKELAQAAGNAADKFFTGRGDNPNPEGNPSAAVNGFTAGAGDINNSTSTGYIHIHRGPSPANKSKHYDVRGKRSERYGILMDKELKRDLQLLCSAANNRSLNDFIVTILLDFVESPRNQEKISAYKSLLNE